MEKLEAGVNKRLARGKNMGQQKLVDVCRLVFCFIPLSFKAVVHLIKVSENFHWEFTVFNTSLRRGAFLIIYVLTD